MSLTSGTTKITGVPRFNGNESKFPFFSVKFKGLIFRLGAKYMKALNKKAPYDWQTYGAEDEADAQRSEVTVDAPSNSGSTSATSSSTCTVNE